MASTISVSIAMDRSRLKTQRPSGAISGSPGRRHHHPCQISAASSRAPAPASALLPQPHRQLRLHHRHQRRLRPKPLRHKRPRFPRTGGPTSERPPWASKRHWKPVGRLDWVRFIHSERRFCRTQSLFRYDGRSGAKNCCLIGMLKKPRSRMRVASASIE